MRRIALIFCAALALVAVSCSKDGLQPSAPSSDTPDFANFPSEEEQEEGLPIGYYAQGHIWYDDNKPAAGVSVSDGFNVTTTDAEGYYSIKTRKDTWHIYFSHPSDALIEKNADGCPDFYRRYVYGKHVYDFRLKRCAVENEFLIVALADPQCHYQPRQYKYTDRRITQAKADVDRFLDETVPALNAHTAQLKPLSCYGVTLGDLVYSEASRNSEPGMTVMRKNFAAIDIPIFQTMGNHDYTFFHSSKPLKTDSQSSSLYLRAQRSFEDCFGPVNHSFNRGSVHFVSMRDINYDNETNASSYHGGFSEAQIKWLREDLKNVTTDKMVVLCVHIPLDYSSEGTFVEGVMNLLKGYPNSIIFSGHKHFHRAVDNLMGSGLKEYIHSAVCGAWWWSRMGGDGTPNGYTFYKFSGNRIADSWFTGYNEGMNSRSNQIRLYQGGLKYGGPYAWFAHPSIARQLYINVFNGDKNWEIRVLENGEERKPIYCSPVKSGFPSVEYGKTYDIPSSSSQDWWTIGFHIGVCGVGMDSQSYYTEVHHMWKVALQSADSDVLVEATDPYGNKYSCSEVIKDGASYPDYLKTELTY